ncbi:MULTISPECIES: hypothetical protein [unclassified Lysobacter]|uniref:hypothetical protein n=1 Tax=unclassified Lysobacter TaxID=2635362 RepID=UPI001BE54D40|nr:MULTISPECIES: hypothetical protein [unclassified Lysobacter]MBT2747725.1 hypothetical protein [Lysobacter sp. ISL-42]MBT2754043.1 hypothetical protein [Lysobacter sp. ISL-50]MBT2779678.1 hypothetical protein [Lysobacter sp. ISL-54]MBT2780143.1 hypothetical protein [Lysobacter sp. ISL-52]
MLSIALTRRRLWLLLSFVSTGALASDAAPDTEQANAAYRRALDAQTQAGTASPLMRSMLDSMKIAAVQGCQRVDAEQTACIVKLDAPMRDGYQAYRFRAEGKDWRIVQDADTPAPQPTLARAQELVRAHLTGLAAHNADPKKAEEFRRFAAGLNMTALNSCQLDRDSGAVECDGHWDSASEGKGSKPLRFGLNSADWSLLAD